MRATRFQLNTMAVTSPVPLTVNDFHKYIKYITRNYLFGYNHSRI